MIEFLLSVLSPIWGYIAAGVGALAAIAGIYFKGKSDAKQEAKVEDMENAIVIRKEATAARDNVAAAPIDKLRDDDGYKRKD